MPAKFTPSQAKNFIRRSLKGVHDPSPTAGEVALALAHFDRRCAFCDAALGDGKKAFHLDHLDPLGPNHVSNRVPACPTCNEVEKRERPWEPFLFEKSLSASVFADRRARIVSWIARNAHLRRPLPPDAMRAIRAQEARAIAAYERALEAIRAIATAAHAGPDAGAGDRSLSFLYDIYAVVNACALRFDGYRYEERTGTPLATLSNRFCETRQFFADERDNLAAFFALQRYLFKWGGEQLPYDSAEHRAYRALYLRLWPKEIDEAFRFANFYDEWPQIYQEHARAVAELIEGLDPPPP